MNLNICLHNVEKCQAMVGDNRGWSPTEFIHLKKINSKNSEFCIRIRHPQKASIIKAINYY